MKKNPDYPHDNCRRCGTVIPPYDKYCSEHEPKVKPKVTHSPGPWELVGNSIASAAAPDPVTEARYTFLCKMTDFAPEQKANPLWHYPNADEQLKNQKLIAAAPDMLKALEGIIENFHHSVKTDEDKLQEFPALWACIKAVKLAGGEK